MARFLLVAFSVAETSATICVDETSLLQMNSRKSDAASQADQYPSNFDLDFQESNSQFDAIRQDSAKLEERIKNMYNAQFDDDPLNIRIGLGRTACYLNEIQTSMDGGLRHWRIAYGNWQGNMADYDQSEREDYCDQSVLDTLMDIEVVWNGVNGPEDSERFGLTQVDVKQIDIKQMHEQYPDNFNSYFFEMSSQIETIRQMTAKLAWRILDMEEAKSNAPDPLNIRLGLSRTSCYLHELLVLVYRDLRIFSATYSNWQGLELDYNQIRRRDVDDQINSHPGSNPDGCDFLGDDMTKMGFAQVGRMRK